MNWNFEWKTFSQDLDYDLLNFSEMDPSRPAVFSCYQSRACHPGGLCWDQCSGFGCQSWSEFWIIQILICKEMCKMLLVLTKSCWSQTKGTALVSNSDWDFSPGTRFFDWIWNSIKICCTPVHNIFKWSQWHFAPVNSNIVMPCAKFHCDQLNTFQIRALQFFFFFITDEILEDQWKMWEDQ